MTSFIPALSLVGQRASLSVSAALDGHIYLQRQPADRKRVAIVISDDRLENLVYDREELITFGAILAVAPLLVFVRYSIEKIL